MDYVVALWRQWKVFLTGGTIIALAALYALTTGRSIAQPWGWGIVVTTFFLASFAAWRKEREAAIAVQTESKQELDEAKRRLLAIETRAPRMKITAVTFMPDDSFLVHVHQDNPGERTSFERDKWLLAVNRADGVVVSGRRGVASSDFLDTGAQSDTAIRFRYDNEIADPGTLRGARIALTATDIRGHRLHSEYQVPTL